MNTTTNNAKAGMTMGQCIKCGGTGSFSVWSHIAAGRCFTCAGTGKMLLPATVSAPEVVGQPAGKTIAGAYVVRHGAGWKVSFRTGDVLVWDDGAVDVSGGIAREHRPAAIARARAIAAQA